MSHLSFDVRVVGAAAKPTVIDSASVELSFQEKKGVFTAEAGQQNIRLAGRVLNISIPLPGGEPVWRGNHDGKSYFYAEIPAVAVMEQKRVATRSLALLWDASGSRAKVNHAVEMEFLDAFFGKMKDIEVSFQTIRDVVEPPVTFTIKNGDWSDLRRTLESVVYDGATNLAAAVPPSADLAFLFSDGLDNYSTEPMPQSRMPLFAFIVAPGADTTRLKGLAVRSGGALIDLRLTGVSAALESIDSIPTRVLSVAGSGVSELVWNPPTVTNPTLTVAGVVEDATLPLRVSFAGADGNPVERIIAGFNGAPESDLIPSTWAAMKIEQLEEEYDLRRGEIRRIGKAFRIATRETSLIVLDNVSDYVRYNIDPPEELKEEYDRQFAQVRVTRNKAGKLDRVAAEWKAREEWWKKDFPKGDQKLTSGRIINDTNRIFAGAQTSDVNISRDGISANENRTNTEMEDEFRMIISPVDAELGRGAGQVQLTTRANASHDSERNETAGQNAGGTEVSIALRPWTPDAPYIRRIKEASNEDVYRIYLDERPDYENSVAFYLDIAYQLQERGLKELSLRVLSNLAEINLENRQILRVLGYRLLEAGLPKQAVVIFEKVLALGEEEPQSYRDLGLAYAAAGDRQKAIDRLYDVIDRDFDRVFPGIEIITLTEMNAVIAEAERADGRAKLDVRRIDSRLLANRPLDLRVVLTWDTDNSDIDLHVIDPNDEEAFYSHPLSYQGGRVSPDNTVGYGPEEYSLKIAKPGKYRVEVNFYGHRQQIISEATTIQLDFFTHYGTAQQKKQSVTMRLKERKDRILVGEFEVK